MSVMSLACALAGNLPTLLVLRLVQGIGVGGEMPVAAVYINELSKAKGRGRFFMLYEMIFPVGLMVTGQIGALVVPTLGWQVMFLIGGDPRPRHRGAAPAAARVAALADRTRPAAEAEAIIREIEASAPGAAATTKDPTTAKDPTARWGFLIVSGSRLVATALAGPNCSLRFTAVAPPIVWTLWASAYFITNGLNNWMPTLYNRVYGLSLEQSLRAGHAHERGAGRHPAGRARSRSTAPGVADG